MDQETVPRERKIPPNSRVARRLDFGGDNFEADLDNFINLTTEVVQTYSERYNFDFDNEIAFCGRYVWSKSDKRTGWLTMAVKEQKDGNEMNQSTVVTADISPTDTRTVAAAAEKTPRRQSAATTAAACDRVLRKREPRDDKTSEKKKMPRDDKTSKKRKMQDAGDGKKTRKSQVKKRLTME